MPENDLESRLAQLAEHGHRTGRLDSAAAVRARADRRRRRRYVGTGALGVVVAAALGAGIAAAQPHAAPAPPAASTGIPASSVVPSVVPSAVPSEPATSRAKPGAKTAGEASPPVREDTASPLSGERQVFIFLLDRGEELPEAVLAVTKQQRVEVTVDYGERALFVPDPVEPDSDRYVVKTGKIRSGGEAFCWSVRENESTPATIVTAACDYGDPRQVFTIAEEGNDNQGRMTYSIRNGDEHLTFDPVGEHGFVARKLGDAPLETTYVFIDRGDSTVPEPGA